MVIFVGASDKGFFLQELPLPEEITYTGYITLDNLKNYVLENTNSCIVIDVTLWTEDSKIIADRINDVAASTRSKVIIFAVGYKLNSKLSSSGDGSNLNVIFYIEGDDYLSVEMEAFGLFYIAKKLGREASCLMTVVDSFYDKRSLSSEERERSLNQMIELALDTAVL